MELIILYLPLFILIYSFYSLPINPGFPVVSCKQHGTHVVYKRVRSFCSLQMSRRDPQYPQSLRNFRVKLWV